MVPTEPGDTAVITRSAANAQGGRWLAFYYLFWVSMVTLSLAAHTVAAYGTPPWYRDDAEIVLATSLQHGLEGVVGKPLASRYHPGGRRDWIKVKNSWPARSRSPSGPPTGACGTPAGTGFVPARTRATYTARP